MYKKRRMWAAGNALEMSAVCGFGGVERPAPNKVDPGCRMGPEAAGNVAVRVEAPPGRRDLRATPSTLAISSAICRGTTA